MTHKEKIEAIAALTALLALIKEAPIELRGSIVSDIMRVLSKIVLSLDNQNY